MCIEFFNMRKTQVFYLTKKLEKLIKIILLKFIITKLNLLCLTFTAKVIKEEIKFYQSYCLG